MFGFALYDSRSSACFLARDRFGIKPLYYCSDVSGGALAFASEVKALVASGLSAGETERQGIIGFLLFGSVPAPATSVRGVECLMPGHYLAASRGKVAIHQYWDPRRTSETGDGAADESRLAGILEDSVNRHLVSDVPVGVFLSGGVDSAGIVALAARTRSRLATLTVVFDESEFSEAAVAQQVAQRFHTDHREVRVTAEDFVREVPSVLAAMDQPTNDGVNTYFVSRAAKQAGLTVVLSGLGGDEIFWGYGHYRWLLTRKNPLHWLGSTPSMLRNGLLNGAVAYGRLRGRENWKRLAFLKNRLSYEALYLAVRGFFAPEQIARLLDMDARELSHAVDGHLDFLSAGSDSHAEGAPAFSQIEVRRYMHDQLLRDTDVFSMAHSIEVRVPYLDHCVTDVAFRLPSETKRPQAMNKPALVRAIGDDLVSSLSRQRKQGFTFPFAHWMLKHAGDLEEKAVHTKLLEPRAVRKLWSAFAAGRLHWSRAWATVVLAQSS